MALDTLDTVQSRNELELAVYAEDTERLQKTLARYRKVVKLAEIQRDDLRDAVVKLSEQIELSNNDFTSWSHSRIHIPRLAEPLRDLPNDVSKVTSERELWAYASGMIRFLRASLDIERRAHKETLRSARATIARLEAQVASRDAELEACLVHSGQAFPRASINVRSLPPLPLSPPPISVPDINDALKQTTEENAALEAEMERLAALLAALSFRQMPAKRQRDHRTALFRPRRQSTKPRHLLMVNINHLLVLSLGAKSVRDKILSPVMRLDDQAPDGDRHRLRDLADLPHPGPSTVTILIQIEPSAQNVPIAALGAKIDGFHLEKTRLLEQVHAVEREDNANTANPRESRSTEPQQHPRQHRHEAQMQAEVPILPPEPSTHGRLLEDYDGEMSMELATPLVPTFMLPQDVAGPSTLPPPPAPTGHFVFAPPPPVSTEISPLDLSTDHPLPGSDPQSHPEPWGREIEVEQPGDSEQAVQELMNIAHARRRES
ncbi:hypothetical protein C8R47DRAFT_1221178 [Mycena vitilis]|nr:hypothetical protein C8R47DRAFT_1221178 [Mycena vitilis]